MTTTTTSSNCKSSPPHLSPTSVTKCIVPTKCLVSGVSRDINLDDITEAVRVLCNNPDCPEGRFMHKECFEDWESTVLSFLRSTGRARSWSEKQRLQNLWTKKGYDLTYKACGCRCGRGHLRKDLNWVPNLAATSSANGSDGEGGKDALSTKSGKKKKNRNKKQQQPSSLLSTNDNNNNNQKHLPDKISVANLSNYNNLNSTTSSASSQQQMAKTSLATLRRQSSSDASTTSNSSQSSNMSTSSSNGGTSNYATSNGINILNRNGGNGGGGRVRTFSISSTGSGGTSSSNGGGTSPPLCSLSGSESSSARSPDSSIPPVRRLFFGESERNQMRRGSQQSSGQSPPTTTSSFFGGFDGGSGISGTMFVRRPDYSSFNILPRTKINSYHIRTEDDSSHGSDDIRTLILSTLSANGKSRVHCILCQSSMVIFERFPLIDGTFFLSPRQYTTGSVPLLSMTMSSALSFLNTKEKMYLNAVCMGCLEGWNCSLRCRGCQGRWNGSHLILGTMYSYDIFAASSCCPFRRQCRSCHRSIQPPRLSYFSDFCQSFTCPFCGVKDYHIVKPLGDIFFPGGCGASPSPPAIGCQ